MNSISLIPVFVYTSRQNCPSPKFVVYYMRNWAQTALSDVRIPPTQLEIFTTAELVITFFDVNKKGGLTFLSLRNVPKLWHF